MKKPTSLIFALFFLFISTNFVLAQTRPVEFYLRCPDSVSQGEEFNVGVYVNPNGNKMNALQVTIDYSQGKDHLQTDLTKIKIVSPFLDLPETKRREGYRIKIITGTFQDISSSSNVLLAIIKFTSLGTNPSELIRIVPEETTAAVGNPNNENANLTSVNIADTQIGSVSDTGLYSSLSITSPLEATTFADFVGEIASYIRDIALVISVIMFLWSGFLFLTSQGNEEKVTKAKKALTWAIIGLAICIIGEGFRFILEQLFKGT